MLRLVARGSPVADGGPGDIEPPGDLAVVEAGADEPEGLITDLKRPHERMFASDADGVACKKSCRRRRFRW